MEGSFFRVAIVSAHIQQLCEVCQLHPWREFKSVVDVHADHEEKNLNRKNTF